MLRMVTPMVAHGAMVIAQRFDLGAQSGWSEAQVDTWHDGIDLRTGLRVRVLQRPTRALDAQELLGLVGLGAFVHVCEPVAHSGSGELPGWIAYLCDEVELASDVFAEGPMTITEAVTLGQGVCAALIALANTKQAIPPLAAETLVLRRSGVDIDVRLLGVGLAWPVATTGGTEVERIAALVFQALTTRLPASGQVPRLADARPELSSSAQLESILRRALGADAPAITSVGALQDELAEAKRAHLRGRKPTSPGLPRPASTLLPVADLAATPGVRHELPGPGTRRRWVPVAALSLVGLGLILGLVLGSGGAEVTADRVPVPAPTLVAPSDSTPARDPPVRVVQSVVPRPVRPPSEASATGPAPSTATPSAPAQPPAGASDAAKVEVLPSPQAPEPTVQPPNPAPAPIKLVITSKPAGAQVSRSGGRLGTTPLELALAASEFPVELRITHVGYVARTLQIDRPDGAEATLDVTLAKARAPAADSRRDDQTPKRAPGGGEFIFER